MITGSRTIRGDAMQELLICVGVAIAGVVLLFGAIHFGTKGIE
jgi:hypothetical protein